MLFKIPRYHNSGDSKSVFMNTCLFQKLRSDAYDEFRIFCKDNRLDTTQKRFTTLKLSMSRNHAFPVLKGKAHNELVVLAWGVHKCLQTRDGSHEAELRFAVAHAWHRFFELCRAAPRFLPEEAIEEIKVLQPRMFKGWVTAANLAQVQGKALWELIPKHHIMYPVLYLRK